jgi:hypothetical protein
MDVLFYHPLCGIDIVPFPFLNHQGRATGTSPAPAPARCASALKPGLTGPPSGRAPGLRLDGASRGHDQYVVQLVYEGVAGGGLGYHDATSVARVLRKACASR